VVSPADRDKIGQIRRAALRPVAQVVPINAQMWVAQAPSYSASLAAAALDLNSRRSGSER
jgi:hypothetical protein